jgi:N-acetylglucosamine-6-sulfatase
MPRRRPTILAVLVAAAALAVAAVALAGAAGNSPIRTATEARSPGAAAHRPPDRAGGAPEARRPGARDPRRPNIVYVLTDDLTADLLRYMPTVRALQRRGVTFSNYFVSASLCCASRASLLTGRYPHSTRVRTNVWPTGGWRLFNARGEEHSTYATDLRSRGYRTALLGKYLNEYQVLSRSVPPGWTTWAVSNKGYHNFDYAMNVDGRVKRFGSRPRDYLTDVIARRSVRFIGDAVRARRPFFLELSTFAPHGPATPAPRDRHRLRGLRAPRYGAWDKTISDGPSWLAHRPPLEHGQIKRLDERFRKRAQSVLAVDRMLRRVERTLRAEGVAGDTYVIFNSDNGFHLGQHRLMPGKMTAFDYDVKVPLIVAGPHVPRGRTVTELVQNIDLRPTFAKLAGAVIPASVQGRSLAALLHGRPAGPWRQTALIEHKGPDLDPSDPDYQAAPGGNPVTYEAIRFAGGLYVASANGEREYYDLTQDPDELHNIYGTLGRARRHELAARLRRLARCANRVACFDAPAP